LNNGYLRYLLQSTPVQDELKARATGTTVLGIKQSELRKVSLTLPSIPEQKSIAHILGTLDEKIELNRRMNVTLESTATAIYQSWFVDFEPVKRNSDGGVARPEDSLFPDSFEDSLNGEIPRGWTLTNLGKVIAIYDSKRIPLSNRQRELRQGPYPYHGAAAVMDHVDDFLFDGIYLLMGEDGSVIKADGTPILQYVWGKFWVNNHAHVLRGTNGLCTEHLMLHLKGLNIAHFVTGAVQPKLNQGNLKQIEIVLPPPAVCDAFSKAVESLFAHIRFNVEASRSLIALRDILLPKLMSGELNVGSVQLTETCQK
jgi:type I restriction enzyme S subunit